ncbi:hypothetical protein [Georgenia sp. SYP-B2076]|nr:hypothetical protein [Georgenia sp. SYP-B2076]
MDMWLELHEYRALDLIREAEASSRRQAARRQRTTPFLARRRRTDG